MPSLVYDSKTGKRTTAENFHKMQLSAGDPNAKAMDPEAYSAFAAKNYDGFRVESGPPATSGNPLDIRPQIRATGEYIVDVAKNLPGSIFKNVVQAPFKLLSDVIAPTPGGPVEKMLAPSDDRALIEGGPSKPPGFFRDDANYYTGTAEGKWAFPEAFRKDPGVAVFDLVTLLGGTGAALRGGSRAAMARAMVANPATGELAIDATKASGYLAGALDRAATKVNKAADIVNPLSLPTRAIGEIPKTMKMVAADIRATKGTGEGRTNLFVPGQQGARGSFRNPKPSEVKADWLADFIEKVPEQARKFYAKSLGLDPTLPQPYQDRIMQTAFNEAEDALGFQSLGGKVKSDAGQPLSASLDTYKKLEEKSKFLNRQYREIPLQNPAISNAPLDLVEMDVRRNMIREKIAERNPKYYTENKDKIDAMIDKGYNAIAKMGQGGTHPTIGTAYRDLQSMNRQNSKFYDRVEKQGMTMLEDLEYEINANYAQAYRDLIDREIAAHSKGDSRFLEAGRKMRDIDEFKDFISPDVRKSGKVLVRDQSGYTTLTKARLISGQGNVGTAYSAIVQYLANKNLSSKLTKRPFYATEPPAPIRRGIGMGIGITNRIDEAMKSPTYPSQSNIESMEPPKPISTVGAAPSWK